MYHFDTTIYTRIYARLPHFRSLRNQLQLNKNIAKMGAETFTPFSYISTGISVLIDTASLALLLRLDVNRIQFGRSLAPLQLVQHVDGIIKETSWEATRAADWSYVVTTVLLFRILSLLVIEINQLQKQNRYPVKRDKRGQPILEKIS